MSSIIPGGNAGDPHPCVCAIPAVQIDDHRRHPFEGARGRERPGVERPPCDELRRPARAPGPWPAGRRRRSRASSSGGAASRFGGGDRVQAGDDRRATTSWTRSARLRASGSGSAPTPFANAIALATDRSGVSPSASTQLRGRCRAPPSALTASTTRSTPRTASSFDAPLTRRRRARSPSPRARPASREPMTT